MMERLIISSSWMILSDPRVVLFTAVQMSVASAR